MAHSPCICPASVQMYGCAKASHIGNREDCPPATVDHLVHDRRTCDERYSLRLFQTSAALWLCTITKEERSNALQQATHARQLSTANPQIEKNLSQENLTAGHI